MSTMRHGVITVTTSANATLARRRQQDDNAHAARGGSGADLARFPTQVGGFKCARPDGDAAKYLRVPAVNRSNLTVSN
jgi:hypothetical protein